MIAFTLPHPILGLSLERSKGVPLVAHFNGSVCGMELLANAKGEILMLAIASYRVWARDAPVVP